MRGNTIAFGWYGGKYKNLGFLLPLFPSDARHFVDAFGGSAAVILNVGRYRIKTYNDIDGDLVNFFQVLRNRGEELINAVDLTPYSRQEFALACLTEPPADELERARLFFVRAMQSFFARGAVATPSDWGYEVGGQKGRKAHTTTSGRWASASDRLRRVATELRSIQVEHHSALDVIKRYDTSGVLFYLDPPYVRSTRSRGNVYAQEMSEDDHRELGELVMGVKGRVAISGYRCSLYDSLYADWRRVDKAPRVCDASSGKNRPADGQGDPENTRVESVWMNYPPANDSLF